MRKSLFDPEYETYTMEANQLDIEARAVLKPLMEKWIAYGYSTPEIEKVISDTITLLGCENRMDRSIELIKKKKKERRDESISG